MNEVIEKKKPTPRKRAVKKETPKSKVVVKVESTKKVENQLVVLENLKPVPFFTKGDDVDEILQKIKADALLHTPDLSTGKGRAAITANISRVTDSKTYLEAEGKALAVEFKSIPAKIDANRKKVKDFLAELQVELRKPLTDWEAEQAELKAKKIADDLAKELAEKVELLHELAIAENKLFDIEVAAENERIKAAEIAKTARLKQEKIDNDKRVAEEASAKAKLEAEQLAQQKIDDAQAQKQKAINDKVNADNELLAAKAREDLLKKQAEQTRLNNKWLAYISEAYAINDQLNAEAEQKRLAGLAEVKRLASIETERLAGIERQRVDRQRIEDEQADRKADEMHRGSIHRAILQALVTNDIDPEVAKNMIRLAAKGLLPNLTINY